MNAPGPAPAPALEHFRFRHAMRVRWADVDIQHVVFNAHYLTYFDTALAEYWQALALPYAQAMRQMEGEVFLRKSTLSFDAPARMDDRLQVALRCERMGRSSLHFAGAIFRDGRALIGAELLYVFADPAAQGSRPVPEALRTLIEAYEAGQPITRVQTGPWATLGEAARAVRTEVFVQEQGIAPADEWDSADADPHTLHAVVFNALNMPVATGRLLRHAGDAPGQARIGRMAVLYPLRGTGLGRQVMQALEQAAAARGEQSLRLSAQRSAEGFYRRLGYTPVGQPYEEVGIAHIDMQRRL